MTQLAIYVPAPDSPIAARVALRSAIVGQPEPDATGRILIHFEGNVRRAANLETFHDKLVVAAGRMVASYPTIALARVDRKQVVRAGTYDPVRLVVTEIGSPEILEEWTGESVDRIMGIRLEPGKHRVSDHIGMIDDLIPLGYGIRHAFRTRFGQVILLDGRGGFTVFEHDDPVIAADLARFMPPDRLPYAVGQEAAATALSDLGHVTS